MTYNVYSINPGELRLFFIGFLLPTCSGASLYHTAENCPARSDSPEPHTERSSRPGSEPLSVEADVYVWHYTLLAVHARKDEEPVPEENPEPFQKRHRFVQAKCPSCHTTHIKALKETQSNDPNQGNSEQQNK